LLLLILLLVQCSHSYKILAHNSKFGHSHSNFLGSVADVLAEAGHNVTTLIPILDRNVRDGTTKTNIIYVEPHPDVEENYRSNINMTVNFLDINNFNPMLPIFMSKFMRKFIQTCEKVVDEPGLIERLREEKYDVYIAQNFDYCGIGLAHLIKPKAIVSSSASSLFGYHFEDFGVPEAPSYRTAPYMSSFDVHSLSDRAWNIYASYALRGLTTTLRWHMNAFFKERFGSDYPKIQEQTANAALIIVNAEPLIDSAAPSITKIVNIGGIGAKPAKPLDEFWTEILTRRKRTVLLSFGSMVKSVNLSPEQKSAIVKMITAFPDITFIWKYEKPEDEFSVNHSSKLANLVLTKWMPQADILAHPNLAAFITHGGMGSTMETASRGVPGIFIPVMGDQPKNAGMMEYNGFGKVFDKFDLHNAEKLIVVVREVLENEKYRLNAKRISKMLASKPYSSRDQLIKHVEFVAEFGPSSALRPQSLDMSFIEYHNLDLIAISIISLSFVVYGTFKVAMFIIKKLANKSKAKKD
ncbi:hypothetical protein PENTCL1PPCAC_7230, partial [Pristionchus entomophagus]